MPQTEPKPRLTTPATSRPPPAKPARRERMSFPLRTGDLDKVTVYGEPIEDPRPPLPKLTPEQQQKRQGQAGDWWRLYHAAKGPSLEFCLRRFERTEITTTRTTNTMSFTKKEVTYWAIYAPPYTDSVPCYTSRAEALRHAYKFLEPVE